ncbi:MAG: ABC transporter ATP-binding protein [Oscillospiraceae bacterium]
MTKLFRYVKRYSVILVAAVLFLFGQAIMDLNLPNMMSNIVNVGIQKSGIEELAPKAISQQGMQFLTMFMGEEDKAVVAGAYTSFENLSEKEQQQTANTFPDAAARQALVITAGKEEEQQAGAAFSRASYALLLFMQQAAGGQQVGSATDTSASFDLDQLQALAPTLSAALQSPQGAAALADVIRQAAATPATMSDSVAAVMNKAFYQQLGADTDKMQTGYILKIGGLMLLISLAVVVCAVGAGYCFARIGAGVARDLRRDIYTKVLNFTNTEMDRFSTSSLITRTTNDVTQIQTLYTMGMRMLVYAPIMGVGGVVMALRKSLSMSWVIALAVIVIMGVILVLFSVVMPKFKKMQSLVDRLSQVARESLSGIMVVRAFSNQNFQEGRFEKANKNLADNNLFATRAVALMMPVMMLVMNGISLLIIWVGAKQISASAMQVGDMMAFMQYAIQIIIAFLFIAMIFVMVPRASVSAERINQVLTSQDSITDPQNPETLGHRAKGLVQFNNVSFRYSGAEEDVLHNISFTAKPGQTTAFIGATGSGKSTVISLIPRFYDVSAGSITIDGVDVRNLAQHELRENIGYIPQKGLLFSGTINSNLRFGNRQASEETLQKAAEVAQAGEFISAMADGFETEISQGGTNVSGGQRQRLSIARALVKKAPIYIFDDSFSALDFATDARLRAALGPYTQGATVLIVAQRVSTIMHAEQIIVLENGNIIGKGTHQELLQSCGAYREIAESQLGKEELA